MQITLITNKGDFLRKSEIEYFKNLLIQRKSQILENLRNSSDGIEDMRNSGASDDADYANIASDINLEASLSVSSKIELDDINRALNKIELGTYGICEMCEDDINIARLKIKPQTKFCITCREILEKQKKV